MTKNYPLLACGQVLRKFVFFSALIITCLYIYASMSMPPYVVTRVFSLKQEETRTSHGPIPHPLKA